MINNALDLERWRQQLRSQGRAQVEQFLQPDAAERLRVCLQREVPWTLALRDDAGARTIDHARYAAMDPAALDTLCARWRPAVARRTLPRMRISASSTTAT